MDFSRARVMTDRHQVLLGVTMHASEHGPVRPVEIVDVGDVIPRNASARWIASGRPIVVVFGTDPLRRQWYACLLQPLSDNEAVEIGFAALGQPLDESDTRPARQNVGLALAELAELYLACVPDRIRQSVRDSGVAI